MSAKLSDLIFLTDGKSFHWLKALIWADKQIVRELIPGCREVREEEIKQCHERYCEEQLKNRKTERVLAAAFSDDFAKEYMSKVMFDYRRTRKTVQPVEEPLEEQLVDAVNP